MSIASVTVDLQVFICGLSLTLIFESFFGPFLHYGICSLFHLVVRACRNLAVDSRNEHGQYLAARPFDRMNQEVTDFVRRAASSIFYHRVQCGIVVHAPDSGPLRVLKSNNSECGS